MKRLFFTMLTGIALMGCDNKTPDAANKTDQTAVNPAAPSAAPQPAAPEATPKAPQ